MSLSIYYQDDNDNVYSMNPSRSMNAPVTVQIWQRALWFFLQGDSQPFIKSALVQILRISSRDTPAQLELRYQGVMTQLRVNPPRLIVLQYQQRKTTLAAFNKTIPSKVFINERLVVALEQAFSEFSSSMFRILSYNQHITCVRE